MSKILKVVGASGLQTRISSYILILLVILSILLLFVGQMERSKEDGNYAATVYYSRTGYRIEFWGQSNDLADIPRGVARAYFRKDVDTDGWSLLEVETDGSYPDDIQAYAAGVVEGALTWNPIHVHLENTIRAKCDMGFEKQCGKLKDELEKSVNVWKNIADSRSDEDPFWHQVSLHFRQINGIFTGWKYGMERSSFECDIDVQELYWLNSISEMAEIQRKMNISLENPDYDILPGLSSAFVKIANETSKDGMETKRLFVAQNAAGNYSSMTRILKRYKLNYHLTSEDATFAPTVQVDFSSYPGSITSQDEFYVLKGEDHRMAVTGTTIKNYNADLWKEVNITEQVPLGPRISAANHLATNVSYWAHVFATNNSGTGCKQWLVVDYNKFDQLHNINSIPLDAEKPEFVTESVKNGVRHTSIKHHPHGKAFGLLWLVEQVPGLVHTRDMTVTLLNQSYFATYGLPYFQDIADLTHVTKMHELYGDAFSNTDSPRALTFEADHKNATNVDAIIKLMRKTNITLVRTNDTDCSNEIECIIKAKGFWAVLGVRGDIVSNYKVPFGIIDTKVVSGAVHQTSLNFIAVAGPPYLEDLSLNVTKLLNKGTVAMYTDKFNNKIDFDNLEAEIDKVAEEAQQEAIDELNKDKITPFQWSETDFEDHHDDLPDKWAFGKYAPAWSW